MPQYRFKPSPKHWDDSCHMHPCSETRALDRALNSVDEENHEKFLSHLDDSHSAVEVVAQHLQSQGIETRISETRRAPDRAHWKQFADQGDITTDDGVIEVKRLRVNFSGRRSWPFKDFIVCAKHSFKRNTHAYYILSNDMRCAAIVRGDTEDDWTVKKRVDSRYSGVSQDFYIAPFECVEWIEL